MNLALLSGTLSPAMMFSIIESRTDFRGAASAGDRSRTNLDVFRYLTIKRIASVRVPIRMGFGTSMGIGAPVSTSPFTIGMSSSGIAESLFTDDD